MPRIELPARTIELAAQPLRRLFFLVRSAVLAVLGDSMPAWVANFWAGVVMAMIFAAIALGVASASLLVRDLAGGGQSAAPAAVVATTAASTPTTAPLATAPLPTATHPAVPGIITVRGTFDPSDYTPLTVVENSIILELPSEGGSVTGSALVRIDNFPIGAILEGIHEDSGGSPADYPELQGCTSVVTLKADIEGSYSPQNLGILGDATFGGDVADRPCLSSLPPGMTPGEAVETTTATLDATFDGSVVVGTFSMPSGEEQEFQATVQ